MTVKDNNSSLERALHVYSFCYMYVCIVGLIFFKGPFLRGLFLEGLIFGGAYLWREICISKSIGIAL